MKEQPSYQKREEVPLAYRWQLEDIFASDQDWEKALNNLQTLRDRLPAFKGRLQDCSSLLAALELASTLDLELMELYAYARMRRDEDNRQARYQDMAERVMSLYYQVQADQAFLEPEISALEPALIRSWLADEPKLAPFQKQLEDIIRKRPHILTEREEMILSRFGPVAQGISDTYTLLDNVDIKLGSIPDSDGRTLDLTHGLFARLREHPDRSVRAAAFRQMHQAYGEVGQTLSALYSTHIKSDLLLASARNHDTCLEAALFENDLPVSLYQSLTDAVHEGKSALDRYFQLRRRWLKLPELHFYDAYIPMVDLPRRRYSYEEACDLLRRGLAPLGPDYLAVLDRHLSRRWIDVCETPGKTNGAYSWGTYRSHPYVLLNYQGTLSDVFTLAHEIGHSLHTYYANQRPYPEAGYSIFLAEIASTVNENLLVHALLDECDLSSEQGRQEKAFLLNHFLESFRTTVFRQTLFAEFEWQTHQAIEQGRSLTSEALCAIYRGLLEQYFAPEIIIDDYMDWEWARIPHFYSSFYVYQYATGFSAAVALSQKILQEGKPAVDRYLDFLAAGGSDYPLKLLARTGINLSGPEPIQAAIQAFAQTLDQMLAMLEENGAWKQKSN